MGIKGTLQFDKQTYDCLIGSSRFIIDEQKIALEQDDLSFIEQAQKQGLSCIVMAINGKFAASITFENQRQIRPETRFVMDIIQEKLQKKVAILSGDDVSTVQSLGKCLNIEVQDLHGNSSGQEKQKFL